MRKKWLNPYEHSGLTGIKEVVVIEHTLSTVFEYMSFWVVIYENESEDYFIEDDIDGVDPYIILCGESGIFF